MDPRTLELFRCLQSGPFDASGLQQIRRLLDSQRRLLRGSGDLATLAELVQLLEGWASSAGVGSTGAAALIEAAEIAERELWQVSLANDLRARAAREEQASPGGMARAARREAELERVSREIARMERALDVNAEPAAVQRLAELYVQRGAEGDRAQAADLYCTLGEVLGAPAGLPYLACALAQVPSHAEAKALLALYNADPSAAPSPGRTPRAAQRSPARGVAYADPLSAEAAALPSTERPTAPPKTSPVPTALGGTARSNAETVLRVPQAVLPAEQQPAVRARTTPAGLQPSAAGFSAHSEVYEPPSGAAELAPARVIASGAHEGGRHSPSQADSLAGMGARVGGAWPHGAAADSPADARSRGAVSPGAYALGVGTRAGHAVETPGIGRARRSPTMHGLPTQRAHDAGVPQPTAAGIAWRGSDADALAGEARFGAEPSHERGRAERVLARNVGARLDDEVSGGSPRGLAVQHTAELFGAEASRESVRVEAGSLSRQELNGAESSRESVRVLPAPAVAGVIRESQAQQGATRSVARSLRKTLVWNAQLTPDGAPPEPSDLPQSGLVPSPPSAAHEQPWNTHLTPDNAWPALLPNLDRGERWAAANDPNAVVGGAAPEHASPPRAVNVPAFERGSRSDAPAIGSRHGAAMPLPLGAAEADVLLAQLAEGEAPVDRNGFARDDTASTSRTDAPDAESVRGASVDLGRASNGAHAELGGGSPAGSVGLERGERRPSEQSERASHGASPEPGRASSVPPVALAGAGFLRRSQAPSQRPKLDPVVSAQRARESAWSDAPRPERASAASNPAPAAFGVEAARGDSAPPTAADGEPVPSMAAAASAARTTAQLEPTPDMLAQATPERRSQATTRPVDVGPRQSEQPVAPQPAGHAAVARLSASSDPGEIPAAHGGIDSGGAAGNRAAASEQGPEREARVDVGPVRRSSVPPVAGKRARSRRPLEARALRLDEVDVPLRLGGNRRSQPAPARSGQAGSLEPRRSSVPPSAAELASSGGQVDRGASERAASLRAPAARAGSGRITLVPEQASEGAAPTAASAVVDESQPSAAGERAERYAESLAAHGGERASAVHGRSSRTTLSPPGGRPRLATPRGLRERGFATSSVPPARSNQAAALQSAAEAWSPVEEPVEDAASAVNERVVEGEQAAAWSAREPASGRGDNRDDLMPLAGVRTAGGQVVSSLSPVVYAPDDAEAVAAIRGKRSGRGWLWGAMGLAAAAALGLFVRELGAGSAGDAALAHRSQLERAPGGAPPRGFAAQRVESTAPAADVRETGTARTGGTVPPATAPVAVLSADAPLGQAAASDVAAQAPAETAALQSGEPAQPAAASEGAVQEPPSQLGVSSPAQPNAAHGGGMSTPEQVVPFKRVSKTQPAASPVVKALVEQAAFRGGRLNPRALGSVIDKTAPKLAQCYTEALRAKPRLKGRLSVSFTIKPNGRVADAKSLGGTLKDTALIGCSLDVIGRTRFPKPRKQSAKVTLPLQFTR